MDVFGAARTEARTLHHRVTASATGTWSGERLITAAIETLDLELFVVDPDDPKLCGALALFDARSNMIVYSRSASPRDRLLHIAHEIGHARMDDAGAACSQDDIHFDSRGDDEDLGAERVEDYGVRERRELRANVFAREFLLPREVARALFLDDKLTDRQIAAQLGLPLELVRQQLFDSLLLPAHDEHKPRLVALSEGTLDASQQKAVDHRGTPFQLQAGPGTGKTRTLVSRLLSLVGEGVDPSTILVLTYSNRAAAELSQRIERAAGERSTNIWIGTIHQFGLDLVRRYHDRLGLPENPRLLDKGRAIGALEEVLPTLDLVHYRNLWDPALELASMVNAFSRAKDELADPLEYRRLAEEMLRQAERLPHGVKGTEAEKAREHAQRALEVAKVYARYEQLLAERGAVDFGDLILRPARLLREPEVQAAVRRRHQHVLVDEYQDVNRASVELLKGIAGTGENLWVVGDSRQSIYRFRGASPANMVAFETDFPKASVERLEVNYRSSSEIVSTYQAFAVDMAASRGMLPLNLRAQHGASREPPQVRTCAEQRDEPRALAAAIRKLVEKGVPLREQAVLCRGNTRLAVIAEELEAQGLPVLHLGNLFEREEVRDLLALLSVVVDRWRTSLVRIGRLPRYRIPLRDAVAVVDHLRSRETNAALPLSEVASTVAGLTPQGRAGLVALAGDLKAIDARATPWDVLATYLFERTDWLRTLARGNAVSERMQAIAVWRLVNFARSAPQGGAVPPIVQMLERVRQLVALSEDRDLRYVPDEALSMDGVRLMTMHGSKGLEFEAVHIPDAVKGRLPMKRVHSACPPPEGLVRHSGAESGGPGDEHDEEEECVFFVALSRAKRHLGLYSYQRTSAAKPTAANPSLYLDRLVGTVTDSRVPALRSPSGADSDRGLTSVRLGSGFEIDQSAVKAYTRCARQFLYSHVLTLGASRRRTPADLTSGVIGKVVEWLKARRLTATPTISDTEAYVDTIWDEHGPVGSGFAPAFRNLVTTVIQGLHRASEGWTHHPVAKVPVPFPSGTVMVTPDDHLERGGRRVWRRVGRGKRPKSEPNDVRFALYRMATADLHPRVALESFSLTDGDTQPIEVNEKAIQTAREIVEEVLAAIKAREFPAKPGRNCPRCAHYFICGDMAEGDFERT